MQALTGRWEHAWHNVTDVTAAFSVVFAFVAAFVCVPSFLLLGRVPRVATDRRLMASFGALVAPTAFMAFRIAFAGRKDPRPYGLDPTLAQHRPNWPSAGFRPDSRSPFRIHLVKLEIRGRQPVANEKRIRVARSRDTILGWTESGHERCDWVLSRVSE